MDYKSWFSKSEPFSDIVIDNLSKEYIENLEQQFPIDFENWHRYENPLDWINSLT